MCNQEEVACSIDSLVGGLIIQLATRLFWFRLTAFNKICFPPPEGSCSQQWAQIKPLYPTKTTTTTTTTTTDRC